MNFKCLTTENTEIAEELQKFKLALAFFKGLFMFFLISLSSPLCSLWLILNEIFMIKRIMQHIKPTNN